MLRESADRQGQDVDIRAVRRGGADPLLPLGREILAMVDASVLRDDDELTEARSHLLDVSDSGVVNRVAAVTANFEMMNRILDAIGAPVGGRDDIIDLLDIVVPEHLVP